MKQRIGIILALTLVLSVWMGVAHAEPALLSSLSSNLKRPTLVALDLQGNIYASETSENTVRIYDPRGNHVKSLHLRSPLGLAVDAAGYLYVASGKTSTIEVYNPDLTFARTFAADIRTNSITFDRDGRMYVVDGSRDRVVVFDAAGQVLFTFGSTGRTEGLFNTPTSLAINDDAGEIYVADMQKISMNVSNPNDLTHGARIQVFDKNGAFKRSFGKYGWGNGEIQKPVGIAVEKTGKLVVVDSGQGRAHVLDPLTGVSVGVLRDPATPPNLPTGIAIGGNNIAYLVSYTGARIDVYALDGSVTMEVDPPSLTFVGTQYAGNPDPQTIVIANAGSGTLNWSATADQAWINLGKQDPVGPKSAGGLAVGVNIPALSAGSYTGTITIDSGFGQKRTVGVTLNIMQPPILTISNGWLNFAAKKGTSPAGQGITLGIDNLTGPMTWSIASNSPSWLTVSPASGILSASALTAAATVSLTTAGLNVGSYSGLLTVNAPGAIGTGSKITVNLTITPSSKISVRTNRAEAKFTVSGPATYTGSGDAWSVEDPPAGDYTVTFEALSGYRKPRPQSKSLAENSETVFTGDYVSWKDIAAKKNIVVAKGPGVKNNAQVKAYKNTGAPASFDLVALETGYGANVALGDIDGDGIAELIVGAGIGRRNPSTVRIYRADRTMLLEFTPFAGLGGVKVAAGDIDGDGAAEVIVMRGGDDETRRSLKAFVYRSAENRMVDAGINVALSSEEDGGITMAAADTDGDQRSEIITAASAGEKSMAVTIWKVNAAKGVGAWTAAQVTRIPVSGKHGPSVAGGDFDGDGADEIVVGVRSAKGKDADVIVLKADGTEQKRFTIASQKHGITVSAADLDGDGVAEVLAGVEATQKAGKNSKGDDDRDDDDRDDDSGRTSEVRVFGADGTLKYAITPFENAKDGINLAVGDLGL